MARLTPTYRFVGQILWLSSLALILLTYPLPLRAQEQLAVYDTASIDTSLSRIPNALFGVSYQRTTLPAFEPQAIVEMQAKLPADLCAAMMNSFDCSRAQEKHLLKSEKSNINRTGQTLTIPIRPSYAIALTDKTGPQDGDWASYFYVGYISEIRRHHVLVGYYEGGDHLLIEAETGEITVMRYAPVLSPDHKWLVAAGSAFGSAFTLQVWQVKDSRLNLETDLTIDNTQEMQAKRFAWNSPTEIEIELTNSAAQHPIALTIGRDVDRWVVSQANKPLPAPVLHRAAVGPYNVYGIETLQVGKRVYRDRDYRFKSIPPELAGQQYLLVANNATRNSDADYIHFALARPATVYIAIDDQALHLPGWMADWQPTPDFLLTDDPINLRLYKKDFAAGKVTLGGNWAEQAAGIRSHYVVVVAPNEQE